MPATTRSMVRRNTAESTAPSMPQPKLVKYDSFTVKDTDDNKQKVCDFNYALDTMHLAGNNMGFDIIQTTPDEMERIQNVIDGKLSLENLELILDSMYSLEHIKKLLKAHIADKEFRSNPENRDISALIWYIVEVYMKIVKQNLLNLDGLPDMADKCDMANRLFRVIIKYDIITRNIGSRFFAHVIWKAIEFASIEGYMPGLLVIGHFYPDMVTDDCHPYINKSSNMYMYDYFKTDEIKKDEVFRTLYERFSKYCWMWF